MKKKKKEETPVDGLSRKDIEKIRRAIRQVWSWSYPRKLCIKRATGIDGFPICEICREKVPKVYPDHIIPVGSFDSGFVERLFCSSSSLQAICKKCHLIKGANDRKKKKV